MTVLLASNCSSTNSEQVLFGRQFWVVFVGAGMFFQTTVSSLHHSWSGQIGTPHTAERDSTSVEVRAQDLGLQLDLKRTPWEPQSGRLADPHSSKG